MAHRGNPHSLPDAGSVIGRDAELAEIEAFLTQTPPPAALVLAGPAGIGKTTLWQAGVAAAREADHRVVVSRPLESDATVSLAGLSDLLEEIVDEVADELPGPQEDALNAALLREGDPRAPPDPRALNAAVRVVLRAAAATRPLLVAIDDVQWLDRSSMNALRHAMRRLDEDQVRLLVSEREMPQSAAADLGFSLERVNRVEVGPLDLEEIRELIARQLGRHLPRPALRRIAELSVGNPFYALELCRSSDGESEPATGFAKGEDLQRLVGDRLSELPRNTSDALGMVAALARPSAAVVGEVLDDETTLDAAFRAGVLAEDGELLRFAHPLLAAAAYEALPPHRRREAHARLAAIVDDPEERSRHLAAATVAPDAAVAAALDAGARAADSRGAPSAAGELLERAASLTPADDREAAARRRIAAARDHIRAGDSRRGADICRNLVAELGPGALRAEALRTLALNEQIVSEAIALGRQAVRECGDNPDLRVDCLLSLAEAMRGDDWAAARAIAHEALAIARTASRPALRAALTAAGELEASMAPGGGREMLREALALEAERTFPFGWWDPAMDLGGAHIWTDELDEARDLLESALQRATDAGDEENAEDIYRYLTQVEVRAGHLARAQAHAEAGMAIAEQEEASWVLSSQLFARALVAAHQGDADLVRELAARGIPMTEGLGDEVFAILHHGVLGFLELSLGNPGEALAHLEPLPARLERLGIREPREPGAFLSEEDAIEALIGTGRIEEAEARLEAWEKLGREIDRPRVLATASRARGLLAADRGDLDRAIASLVEALRHHDCFQVPIERGRTLVALGSAYRRAGQRRNARATLEEALKIFERIGARIWADRARAELGRLGGRAPSGDQLTPTERQVAELVAEGRTNKDVAAALFVTVRTVESNLTRVYSKLGIHSRTELAARGLPPEDEPSR
jgi:DNA-binding CsgD family transcriptional regulator